ncbi:hypothetical protein ABZZ74_52440 [Streptomyces sp. NPDC006476]|uniref:5'-methylthioadenosine/S-adenosylhomocysteine nucleosidase family protein n=1 Tax=Streptomyces sp. NPDC006476 TaxID=3157175 RepID=UPI0033BD8069
MNNSAQGDLPDVGIVTALPKEFAAAKAMLDDPQDAPPHREDHSDYVIGRIPHSGGGAHSVVLTLQTKPANNVASIAVTNLKRSFPSVDHVLMVGIAGGVPNHRQPSKHVRLGDIVISGEHGVIQYDHLRLSEGVAELKGTSPLPSPALLNKVNRLEAERLAGKRPWERHVRRGRRLLGASRPSPSFDKLYHSRRSNVKLEHPTDVDRITGQPKLYYGRIASANILLKDPLLRDVLRDQLDVRAVEMEGSGISDAAWVGGVGYLVIRGICDYCDSRKGDTWQAYASVVAAAYARALIEALPVNAVSPSRPSVHPLSVT